MSISLYRCRGPESILCSKLSQSSAKSHDKCGLMEDTKGPFKQCIINAPDLADQFFNACWQDLCLHGSKQDIICQKLSTFADMCATLGFPAEWRSNEFCRKLYIYIYIYYLSLYISIYTLSLSLSLYIYIYIYRERERECACVW